MQYPAVVTKEGKYTLAEFPDCPGCQTFVEGKDDLMAKAADALDGWLSASLAHGDVPKQPSRKPAGKLVWIPVAANLAAKLEVRWARHKAGLTQRQLAKRAGVSQAMIAKVENPRYSPSLGVLEKVAHALGRTLRIGLETA